MRVLVIAAHPDDEVLGCGATISKLAGQGYEVHIAILGEGIASRYKNREEADKGLLEAIKNISRQAGDLLGAKELYMRSFPDNRFDSVPLLTIIKEIENLIEKVQPQVVYTHHGGDLNIDHVITARAVITAARPLAGCPVKEIYAFEVPSATEWAFNQFKPEFRPNTFIDVSQTLEVKIKAMLLYKGEVRSFPHPRSTEALRAIAGKWGSVAGVQAAEAFELVRKVE